MRVGILSPLGPAATWLHSSCCRHTVTGISLSLEKWSTPAIEELASYIFLGNVINGVLGIDVLRDSTLYLCVCVNFKREKPRRQRRRGRDNWRLELGNWVVLRWLQWETGTAPPTWAFSGRALNLYILTQITKKN